MKNIISKLLIFLVFFNLISITDLTVFAENNVWSGESIGAFLYNEIDAPNVLKDEKYTKNITREEFAELIVGLFAKSNNMDKNSIEIKENPFKDTTNLDVQRAYSLGIIQGVNKNTFKPNDNITREQIATMITRFLTIKGININTSNTRLNTFRDKDTISKWAYSSLSYCVEQEIIKGIKDDLLRPKNTATVEQVVTMLYRLSLKNGLFNDSKDIYISGFYIPKRTEFKQLPSDILRNGEFEITSRALQDDRILTDITIHWNNVNDMQSFEKDLNHIFKNKLDNNEQLNNLVKTIINLKNKDSKVQTLELNNLTIQYASFCVDWNPDSSTSLSIYEKIE